MDPEGSVASRPVTSLPARVFAWIVAGPPAYLIVPGWILAASIAGATTMTLGVVAMRWFESGRKTSRAQMWRLLREIQDRLVGVLKAAFRRKPKKAALTERLETDLSSLADSVDSIDEEKA